MQILFPLALAHLLHEQKTLCSQCRSIIAERSSHNTVHIKNLKNIAIQAETKIIQGACIHCRRVYTIHLDQ